jgi:hypothetical protein
MASWIMSPKEVFANRHPQTRPNTRLDTSDLLPL